MRLEIPGRDRHVHDDEGEDQHQHQDDDDDDDDGDQDDDNRPAAVDDMGLDDDAGAAHQFVSITDGESFPSRFHQHVSIYKTNLL